MGFMGVADVVSEGVLAVVAYDGCEAVYGVGAGIGGGCGGG